MEWVVDGRHCAGDFPCPAMHFQGGRYGAASTGWVTARSDVRRCNADLSHLPSNTLLDHLAEVPPIPKQSGHPIRPKAPALLMGEAGSAFGNLNRARSFLRFGSPLQRRQGRIIGAPENMAAAWSRRPLWAAKRSSF
jgi:hypothetical protein